MIDALLQTYKRITLANSLSVASSLGLFVFTSAYWWNSGLAFITALVSVIISLLLTLRKKNYWKVNSSDFLEHINRHFSEYQESAQLLERTTALTSLQLVQKKRIENQFNRDLDAGRLRNLQPQFNFVLPLLLLFLSLVSYSISDDLHSIYSDLISSSGKKGVNIDSPEKGLLAKSSPSVIAHKVLIQPPSYTEKTTTIASQLDFEAIQGSSITSQIEFSRPELEYYYTRSGKPAVQMTKQDLKFVYNDSAEQTSLYKFSYMQRGQLIDIDGVYTITLIRDAAPKISITRPRTTLLEFAKSENPEFTLSAEIKDDFGISDVKILASVAKGSGEAVKFRDKTFRFSPSEITSKVNSSRNKTGYFKNANYQKSWSLNELQMEPGDEAYFSLQAFDNKQPERQLSKSNNIIVRWLDEDEVELALEGIQIKFIPEYFRSQRQIIIETEQLIADDKDISRDKFDELSTELGNSQSDLKQKYGQYLGDEFGEGQGAQLGLADGYHGGETMSSGEASAGLDHDNEDDLKEEHNEEEHHNNQTLDDIAEQQTHNHQHNENNEDNSNDLSGARQLIDQFGHNHSSVEVAPLSRKDPKSWMKMAVNEMWKAELHLMMSEPSKALPYEYKAYKYLKLARQAERVYAKRLGFEPPPVSEERRLTGELKAILEYDLSKVIAVDSDSDSELFSSAIQLLSQRDLENRSFLTEKQQITLSSVSQKLLKLSEQRPTLIKYAAMAEKLALSKNLGLDNCENCVSELEAKLWQLIPPPLSRPSLKKNPSRFNDKVRMRFIEANGERL